MRKPSADPYYSDWHDMAVRGLAVEVHEGEPHPGYFKRRKKPHSREWYPAAIWWEGETDESGELTGDETLRCHIAGFDYDAHEAWTQVAKHPIPQEEYDELMEAMTEPSFDPWLNDEEPPKPAGPVDHLKTPIPF